MAELEAARESLSMPKASQSLRAEREKEHGSARHKASLRV